MQSHRLFLRAVPSDRTLIERSAKNPPFAAVVVRARYLSESVADGEGHLLLGAIGQTPCRLVIDVGTPELFDSRVASDRDARRLRESGIGRSVELPLTHELAVSALWDLLERPAQLPVRQDRPVRGSG